MKIVKPNASSIWILNLIALALFICHVYIYFRGEPADTRLLSEYIPLIRASACAVFIAGSLIKKQSFMRFFFPVYSFIILYWNRYYNFTSFLVIVICGHLTPKDRKWLYPCYCIDLLAALLINPNLTPAHALVHIGSCAGILALYHIFFDEAQPAPQENSLDLTEDEMTILKELSDGRPLKSVQSFSKNTVTKKMKEARDRNGCINNEALLARYCAEPVLKSQRNGDKSQT